MNMFAKALLAGAVAVMAASPANATRTGFADHLGNIQNNFATSYSHLLVHGEWLGGLRATSAAIGNNGSLNITGNFYLYNAQTQLADVGATLKAYVQGVHGDATLQAIGICNNFSATNTQTNMSVVDSLQRCNTLDPFAVANVNLSDVGGDAAISAVAIGNNFSMSTSAPVIETQIVQVNAAATYSGIVANVSNIAGDVTITSAAIGNNTSITSILDGQ
jgi:hypothetical protein